MDINATSLWHDTASRQPYGPPPPDATADIVVVGAGITGLTTALLLASEGADVAVVEALDVAGGVTGRSTAKVTSQHSLLHSKIAAKHGEEVAGVYASANAAAVEHIATLIAAHGIDCDFERRDAYVYTQDPGTVATIEREVELCQRLGLPAEFTSATDLPFEVAGAMRFPNQAQLQPVAYCEGLARAVVEAGGRVWTGTRLLGVDGGAPFTLNTDRGTISAREVVLATHIPVLDRGVFFAKVEPTASHGIAARVEGTVPQGMYISADEPTRSVRSYTHGENTWLVVVGEGHRTGEGDEVAHEQALESFAGEHWPSAKVTHRWMAQDYTSQDLLPYIGKLSRTSGSIFVATGFAKWGFTNGTAAAQLLADLINGRDNEWASVFDAQRLTPVASATSFVSHNLKTSAHLVGDRLHLRGPAEVEALAPGEGTVARIGTQQVAVSKDPEGTVQAVSAVCTHMGCIVAFNAADRSWDCPCHGSRFAADGEVLHGPATKPLEPVDLPTADTANEG